MARIADLPLDASVVDAIAQRDGLDATQARALALDTLRLAALRREETVGASSEGGLDEARRQHILRTARARLWLDTEFEPTSGPDDIPLSVLDENLDDPKLVAKHFHSRQYLVCNVLVLPAEKDEHGRNREPPAGDRQWQARAEDFMDAVRARLRVYDEDLRRERDCTVLAAYLANFEAPDATLELRVETIPAGDPEQFVAEFSDRVFAVAAPQTILEPFHTRFGLHLVYVLQMREEKLADGSLPAPELRERRREALRELMHEAWREHHFKATVDRLREQRVVRVAQAGDTATTAAE